MGGVVMNDVKTIEEKCENLLNVEIRHEFEAYIGYLRFDNQTMFYTCRNLLSLITNKYKLCNKSQLMRAMDLIYKLYNLDLDTYAMMHYEIRDEITNYIYESKNIDSLIDNLQSHLMK